MIKKLFFTFLMVLLTGSNLAAQNKLTADGVPMIWARTLGDNNGIYYELPQDAHFVAPKGMTIQIINVSHQIAHQTNLNEITDMDAYIVSLGSGSAGYGNLFYRHTSGNWDHWSTDFIVKAIGTPEPITKLTPDGVPVIWARTLGDNNGIYYDLPQDAHFVAPEGMTIQIINVAQQIAHETNLNEITDMDAYIVSLGSGSAGYGNLFYRHTSGNWDYWSTDYIVKATGIPSNPVSTHIDLLEDGTQVQWAHTNGDNTSGIIYDIPQSALHVKAPEGMTIEINSNGPAGFITHQTNLNEITNIHLYLEGLVMTQIMWGDLFYMYMNTGGYGTWDHWSSVFTVNATGTSSYNPILLNQDGTQVQWAHTNGDNTSGMIYDLPQSDSHVKAPEGMNIEINSNGPVGFITHKTNLNEITNIHLYLEGLAMTQIGMGWGDLFYMYMNTGGYGIWDHWSSVFTVNAYGIPLSEPDINADTLVYEVYPNPSATTIKVDIEGPITVVIYNINGEKLIEDNKNEIDISKLDAGMYILNLVAGNKVSVSKFIKR